MPRTISAPHTRKEDRMNVDDVIKQLEKDAERLDEQVENIKRLRRLEEQKERERLWDEVHGSWS